MKLPVLALAIPVLTLAPMTALAESDKAHIVTQNNRKAECISAVHIRKLDGKNKFLSAQGFSVEPGAHTMSGSFALLAGACSSARINSRVTEPTYAPLEAEFEAGKTYYVGFDHSADKQEDWKYVIWKIE